MAQFSTPFGGNLDIWAVTVEERAKHDQQFHSLKPISGFITGDQARNFFFQSGLPQPVLAQIWYVDTSFEVPFGTPNTLPHSSSVVSEV